MSIHGPSQAGVRNLPQAAATYRGYYLRWGYHTTHHVLAAAKEVKKLYRLLLVTTAVSPDKQRVL